MLYPHADTFWIPSLAGDYHTVQTPRGPLTAYIVEETDEIRLIRRDPFSRVYYVLDPQMSGSAFMIAVALWNSGKMIQDAFPTLDAADREFLITGMVDSWPSKEL
jgi:hypothetical protein